MLGRDGFETLSIPTLKVRSYILNLDLDKQQLLI